MAEASKTGKDERTGRYLPGNRFWEARSSHGRHPIFRTPEELWGACVEYFEWAEENPLHEAKAFAYEGAVTVEPLPKMRAMTITGLCLFLDISFSTWDEWRRSRPDLSEVITRAEAVIYSQKFEGAAAGLLVPNIIARDLGLADKQEHSGPGGGPIRTINSEMSTKDAAEAYAETLRNNGEGSGGG